MKLLMQFLNPLINIFQWNPHSNKTVPLAPVNFVRSTKRLEFQKAKSKLLCCFLSQNHEKRREKKRQRRASMMPSDEDRRASMIPSDEERSRANSYTSGDDQRSRANTLLSIPAGMP